MCRLLGVRANQPVELEFSLILAGKSFSGLGAEHRDGWGMGWYVAGKPHVFKEVVPAPDSKELPRLAREEVSHIFICHVRKMTEGERKKENCHPFQYESWLFAHNGSVKREPLWDGLDTRHREAIQGKTDSEVYFHWILQNIDNCQGDVVSGVRLSLQSIVDYSGLNFILSDGESLYAYRDASKNCDYYSLYYLMRDPTNCGPETFQSTELGTLIRSKGLREEKAVMVCSEQLTPEAWQKIPLRFLLVISSDLKPQLVKLR